MIKKSYKKNSKFCVVTFKIKPEEQYSKIELLGDFNDWKPGKHVLKKRKDGYFSVTVYLEKGNKFRFRYLADEKKWLDDDSPDDKVPNKFGTFDNVVEV